MIRCRFLYQCAIQKNTLVYCRISRSQLPACADRPSEHVRAHEEEVKRRKNYVTKKVIGGDSEEISYSELAIIIISNPVFTDLSQVTLLVKRSHKNRKSPQALNTCF